MRLLSSLAALAAVVCIAVVPVSAAVAAPADAPGADVSWPQCDGRAIPTAQAFGIVGVNNGLGNTTNACLAEQLAWAGASTGSSEQPTTSLYAMAQNPGHEASWWPSSNRTRAGTAVSVPQGYGACVRPSGATVGPENSACAYVYGYSVAEADAARVANPGTYFWWIDVEEGGISWLPDTVVNSADVEGMVAAFAAIHAASGIYSTPTQWRDLAGTTPATSPLAGLANWIAGVGAGDQASATANCAATAFTPASTIALAQYVAQLQGHDQDYDLSCRRLASTPVPTLSGSSAVNQRLTAQSGAWWPATDTLYYQWTRDGKAIAGATAAAYLTVAADASHQIRVVTTGSQAGSAVGARTSAAVKIAVPTSRLTEPHTLGAGSTLLSPNGRYHLTQQTDGNLVLYKDTGKAIWSSHTFGKSYRTTMQADGNLVTYTSTHQAVWASRTSGKHATSAVVQSDGNLVLYTAAGKAVWATRTNGK